MDKERLLVSMVAIRNDYTPDGACVAWVDSRDSKCGNTTDYLLCPRHVALAQKRLMKEQALLAARPAKEEAYAAERQRLIPEWRTELERVETDIRRLDPPPVTTDRAAYGGAVHPRIAVRSRVALSDFRVERLARLHRERERLIKLLGDDR